MTLDPVKIPLTLYIHMPWCVKKCPYCDFNSHTVPETGLTPQLERDYLWALLADFKAQLPKIQRRTLTSIFVGGGTPSLISAGGYQFLFEEIQKVINFQADMEITIEANAGTLEHAPFADYLAAGINRLSVGVQSFNDAALKRLGRIHSADEAKTAIIAARQAGFERVNVDLMHGLPGQTLEQALFDLQAAILAGATHISWYQLTIEPNTVFFREQPILPDEDTLADIQAAGEELLIQAGFMQYEVSAWTKATPCRHNVNYWEFGDYLAIGAGAHGKITYADRIERYQKSRLPRDYLAVVPAPDIQTQILSPGLLPFEFMLNALRLVYGVPYYWFEERTGLPLQVILPVVEQLRQRGLMSQEGRLVTTPQGLRYLNQVLNHFLADETG